MSNLTREVLFCDFTNVFLDRINFQMICFLSSTLEAELEDSDGVGWASHAAGDLVCVRTTTISFIS